MQTTNKQGETMTTNEQSRIGSELTAHYVVSETTDIVHFGNYYFVWHHGKSVAAYSTDTEAIAYADSLPLPSPQKQGETMTTATIINELYVVSCIETRYPRLEQILTTMGIKIIDASAQCQIVDVIVRMTPVQANELFTCGYHVSEV